MKLLRGWFWILALVACAWLAPLIFLSTLIAFGTQHPRRWLILLAIAAELLTFWPLGVATVIIFTPWLARRFFPTQEAGVSFSFLVLIAGIVLIQYLLAAGFELGWGAGQPGFREVWRYVPWLPLLFGVVSCSLTAFALFALRGLFLSMHPRR